MPYSIDKVKGGYYVKDTKGKKLEKKPLKTLKQAQKQRVAVYLSTFSKTGGKGATASAIANKGEDVKHFFI
jgi:hypothetical protein